MNPTPANFTLHSFQDEEFATFPKNYQGGKKGNTLISLDFGYEASERIIACRASVEFSQNGNTYLICRLGGGFRIAEKSWDDRMNEEKTFVTIERELHIHIAMFLTGGLRGFLHARQQQSEVAAFLGPVNILELIGDKEFLPVPLHTTHSSEA